MDEISQEAYSQTQEKNQNYVVLVKNQYSVVGGVTT